MLALAGCGQSGPTSGNAASDAGPGIDDLYDCDDVRAVYRDAMTDLTYDDAEDDLIYVAQAAVERMHELGCDRGCCGSQCRALTATLNPLRVTQGVIGGDAGCCDPELLYPSALTRCR